MFNFPRKKGFYHGPKKNGMGLSNEITVNKVLNIKYEEDTIWNQAILVGMDRMGG